MTIPVFFATRCTILLSLHATQVRGQIKDLYQFAITYFVHIALWFEVYAKALTLYVRVKYPLIFNLVVN